VGAEPPIAIFTGGENAIPPLPLRFATAETTEVTALVNAPNTAPAPEENALRTPESGEFPLYGELPLYGEPPELAPPVPPVRDAPPPPVPLPVGCGELNVDPPVGAGCADAIAPPLPAPAVVFVFSTLVGTAEPAGGEIPAACAPDGTF
jgi:hypothetical protein